MSKELAKVRSLLEQTRAGKEERDQLRTVYDRAQQKKQAIRELLSDRYGLPAPYPETESRWGAYGEGVRDVAYPYPESTLRDRQGPQESPSLGYARGYGYIYTRNQSQVDDDESRSRHVDDQGYSREVSDRREGGLEL